MLTRKLKPLPLHLVALAAALFLSPVSAAEAWQRVCLKNMGAYDVSLVVVYGFEENGDMLPARGANWTEEIPVGGKPGAAWREETPGGAFPSMTHPAKVAGFDEGLVAAGVLRTSAPHPPLERRCVDISSLEEGARFFAVAVTDRDELGGRDWAVCDTGEGNPRPFHRQRGRERPRDELWFASRGVAWDHWCGHGKAPRPR